MTSCLSDFKLQKFYRKCVRVTLKFALKLFYCTNTKCKNNLAFRYLMFITNWKSNLKRHAYIHSQLILQQGRIY